MKNLLLILFVLVVFSSCGSGPESSARNFAENLAKGDIEEAKKYTTTQTGALLDMANGMKTDKMPNYPDYKFKMISDSIVGDTAWVTYTAPTGDEEVLNLIKVNGDWKVTVGK